MADNQPTTGILRLETDQDWIDLHTFLSPDIKNQAVANIVEQLKEAGVQSAIVEYDYLDRDFSEEFKAFYATLFGRYRRHTKRLHFFTIDVTKIVNNKEPTKIVDGLEAASNNEQYVGFLVIRPIIDAPIGRAVLRVLKKPTNVHTTLQVRASYETHVLGATLKVIGMPFTQQDTRITACAQASIWTIGRHFHTRHGGPWYSTVQIAEAASKPTDALLASSLPAGAGGLGMTNMVRALRAMERHPYAFAADRVEKGKNKGKLIWPYLSPEAILARYVESGIPVIVGLDPWEKDQRDGHAVVVVGTTFRVRPGLTFTGSQPNIAEYIPYFLVHDDQRGINLRMPVVKGQMPIVKGQTEEETPYNIRDHVFFILVPLPDKVFITAEAAEIKAWDLLSSFYGTRWSDLKAAHAQLIGASVSSGDKVTVALSQKFVVARTYLRIGWKYKRQIVNSLAHETLKTRVMFHDLPRMVWVTEFGFADELNRLDPSDRRVFAHCVHDATASGEFHPPLILHVPGFVWLWSQTTPDFFTDTREQIYPILNDVTYEPRRRK